MFEIVDSHCHLDFKDFIGEKKNLSCDNLFVWSEGMKINLSKYI